MGRISGRVLRGISRGISLWLLSETLRGVCPVLSPVVCSPGGGRCASGRGCRSSGCRSIRDFFLERRRCSTIQAAENGLLSRRCGRRVWAPHIAGDPWISSRQRPARDRSTRPANPRASGDLVVDLVGPTDSAICQIRAGGKSWRLPYRREPVRSVDDPPSPATGGVASMKTSICWPT